MKTSTYGDLLSCQPTMVAESRSYTLKFIEEIEVDAKRPLGADLTPSEMSAIRGALGTAWWRATQSAPQFLADTSLLLGEVEQRKRQPDPLGQQVGARYAEKFWVKS